MRTGYVFLLFANRIFTEQETTNIIEDNTITINNKNNMFIYLIQCTFSFPFLFSLPFTIPPRIWMNS